MKALPHGQRSLYDPGSMIADPVHEDHARIDQAVDSIRQRFGTAAVSRGSQIGSKPSQSK